MVLPVMSIARNPACSSALAAPRSTPARIRRPHRLCWPSRNVWSTNSMVATALPVHDVTGARRLGPRAGDEALHASHDLRGAHGWVADLDLVLEPVLQRLAEGGQG